MSLNGSDKISSVDELASRIRSLILSGDIPLGAPLHQEELAKQFGTSRTPIREALRQLQNSGLIDIQPNRGATVRIPAPWEIREIYEIRAELEALAARRAVSRLTKSEIKRMRADNDALSKMTMELTQNNKPSADHAAQAAANELSLHVAIHRAANNVYLQKMLDELPLLFPNNKPSLLLVENARHREENHDAHARILDAFEQGNADLAADLMREHVLKSGEQIARWFELHSTTMLNK
ncbi:MAG: GntR family transcriptional regulator [Bifidobacterium tibiigranuli]|uniref:GntR family transcriptional regulator n=1 Tax=Bifidobacterium tibiigranuli TaxID=2172043 RepID=UPI0026F2A1C3|nr:GntR family transcriptional regulator [Bifidobacterium tibiigranuli]MCI1674029.1 GntR family transcriptional regulator [Bifidobacterium tibiigranuli]MCI1713999.1 GntR family transcriptional regulator [Bifidobacterium tibiigranuli]MCI1833389.1 GntR family transcriptional regulator [Bifidobacterium tibiigranuli]